MVKCLNTTMKANYFFATVLLAHFCCSEAYADMQDIPVPLATIQAGKKILISDLVTKNFYVSDGAARLFATTVEEVEGKIAKRTLVSGRPIAQSYLRLSGTVVQGNPTKVVLEMEGLTITTLLIPQQSGVAGQTIEALNPDSGKIVKALVNADGSLQIGVQ